MENLLIEINKEDGPFNIRYLPMKGTDSSTGRSRQFLENSWEILTTTKLPSTKRLNLSISNSSTNSRLIDSNLMTAPRLNTIDSREESSTSQKTSLSLYRAKTQRMRNTNIPQDQIIKRRLFLRFINKAFADL